MMKIGIGVMGCAAIAKRSMIPAILNLKDRFRLVAVASRDEGTAREFADMFCTEALAGYDRLLSRDDVSIVYMPLPTGLHYEWISKAIMAGKHVLVEKSFALSYSEAKDLVAMAREKGVLLMESFMFCHHSQHLWVKQKLSEIGSIRLFRSQFGFPPLQSSNFRYDPVIGGGSLLDAGAYTVKASQMFFGTGAEVLSSVLYVDPVRSTDLCGSVTLLTEAGIVCQLSFGFDNAYQCNYEFWGSAGRILSEKAFTPKSDEFPPVRVSVNGSAFDQLLLNPDNHFEGILKSFHEALQTRSFENHHLDILDQARILDTIRSSAVKVNYEGSSNRG